MSGKANWPVGYSQTLLKADKKKRERKEKPGYRVSGNEKKKV